MGSTGWPHSADLRKCWHATPLSVSAFRPVYSRSNLDVYSVHLCRHFCCSLSWNSGYWLHIPHSMQFLDSQCSAVFTTHFPSSEDLFIFFMYINISWLMMAVKICTHARTQACTHTRMHARIYTCTHTHTHARMHTHTTCWGKGAGVAKTKIKAKQASFNLRQPLLNIWSADFSDNNLCNKLGMPSVSMK